MCDFEKGFILCTCEPEEGIIHNKKSRRFKEKLPDLRRLYHWYLSEYKGEMDNTYYLMEGIYELPVSDIGKGLTEEWVLLHLNFGNCFDFEYTPKEGDNLIIKSTNKFYEYLSFIYTNGEWKAAHYNIFDAILQLKKDGEVKQIDEPTTDGI
jgi:hypothetical protein